jgi:LmbE family N-acetylglucosaminyl deacetylase
MYHWIFLSPHFDDAVLSCGGMIWEQAAAGNRVEIWTICAGEPDAIPLSPFAAMLHERWGTGLQVIHQRRTEDEQACQLVGAAPTYFFIPDCIYRRGDDTSGEALYAYEDSLFGPLDPREEHLVESLANQLQRLISSTARIVSPLAIGNHVDHQLVRRAAELLDSAVWYYPDYPYVLNEENLPGINKGWVETVFPLSTTGLSVWQQAVAAYSSQISTFWTSLDHMKTAISAYAHKMGGVCLWRPPGNHSE